MRSRGRARRGGALAVIGALTAALGLVPGLVAVAQASDWYNDYSVVGDPRFVAGATPFTIAVDGPDAVCAMTYDETTLTAAPWTFTFVPDPNQWGTEYVDVVLCDGQQDSARVNLQLAFDFRGSVVGREGSNRFVTVTNHTDQPGRLVVTDRRGRVVVESELPAADSTAVRIPLANVRDDSLTATATGPNGISMQHTVLIARDWSTFFSSGGTFAPCSVLTWSFSTAGMPSNRRGMKADVKKALARLHAQTGLRFVPVRSAKDARIRFTWKNMGAGGPSGMGGTDGSVVFNTRDFWTTDAYAGFGLVRGSGGRGWLVVHEVMHVLGMDHVAKSSQIMAAVDTGQIRFGKGDLAGLHALYPKAGCSA